jgi:hypothetical protein
MKFMYFRDGSVCPQAERYLWWLITCRCAKV